MPLLNPHQCCRGCFPAHNTDDSRIDVPIMACLVCVQQPPADRISNVLNGGNDGGNGGGRNGASRNFDQDSRANTGDQGGRSAADIAATSPQSNVFRSGVKTAATNPRELRCRRQLL